MLVPTHGFTEPRIWTKPLRELTPETSRGFDVIKFAREDLRVSLFPWQEWLLIHLLELNLDGTLRFEKALVIVGRQNGKTAVGAVLAAYWMFVDAGRWPEQTPEQDFIIVGGAQKLDIAMKPWRQVRRWAAPDDEKLGIAADRRPHLQELTRPPRTTNGEIELRTIEGGTYLPRTFDGARGHSASRLLLDELREQYDYEGWSAIEKSANAMYDSLLVAFSNAGTKRSQVLKDVRAIAHESIDDPDAQWFVAEWSAKQNAPLTDPMAFAQANPSAGYLPGMTIRGLMRAAADAKNKNVERIEVLGQWVTAAVENYIDIADWRPLIKPVEKVAPKILPGSRTVWGVDMTSNRSTTWVGAAVQTTKDMPFATVRTKRAGNLWLFDYLEQLADASGHREVVVQARGTSASELVDGLQKRNLIVHAIDGGQFAAATGRLSDHVRDRTLMVVNQKPVNKAVEGGVVMDYAQNKAWNRPKSLPIDISGLVAMTVALYGLEMLTPPPPPEPSPPPPAARLVSRPDTPSTGWADLA